MLTSDESTCLFFVLPSYHSVSNLFPNVVVQRYAGIKRNKQRTKNGQPTYKELLEALKAKRIVFIFDECHRSQFGDNHRAIKGFFPRAQLFGFTNTPTSPRKIKTA